MHRQIAESDWKKWRKLSDVALERYCDRVLQRAAAFSMSAGSSHARYAELFRFVRESDKELAGMFDGRSRSNAYSQLAAAVAAGLVTPEELLQFTDETQQIVTLLAEQDS